MGTIIRTVVENGDIEGGFEAGIFLVPYLNPN